MPSYGSAYLDYLKSSDSDTFRAWGQIMEVGVSVMDGLQRATEQRYFLDKSFPSVQKIIK